MSPNKAIVIILILFLVISVGFIFLYTHKQLSSEISQINSQMPETNLNGTAAGTQSVIINQKVVQAVEAAKQNKTQNSPEQIRQVIVDTTNNELIKIHENQTPEQKAAALKEEQIRQKLIDDANNLIKQQRAGAQVQGQ